MTYPTYRAWPFGPAKKELWKGTPEDKQVDRETPESVIFVPHTPNSDLKRIIQEADREMTKVMKFGQNKVVERLGSNLGKSLCNRAPWRKEECTRSKCVRRV